MFYANGNEKKLGAAILISDKIDCKTKAIKKRRIPYNDMSQYKKRI